MGKGMPPCQFLRRVNGAELITVACQRGMNDWDALESKAGRISVIDELFMRFTFDITSAANDYYLTYEYISAEATSISFQTRTGREIVTGVDGEYYNIQHLLSRANFADALLNGGAQTTGIHKVPVWMGTYWFDLEEYPLAVADAGALQINRGGTVPNETNTALTEQLIARGRFLQEAPTKRREWFMVADATEVHLPRGRYHFIAICNPKSANGNLYDGGLTVTGPDIAINNEDGRDLQRAFQEDYAASRAEEDSAALDPIVLDPNDTSLIEDIIQPIYWGGADSITWQTGVNGPITIRKDDTDDPDMYVYCLRCVE